MNEEANGHAPGEHLDRIIEPSIKEPTHVEDPTDLTVWTSIRECVRHALNSDDPVLKQQAAFVRSWMIQKSNAHICPKNFEISGRDADERGRFGMREVSIKMNMLYGRTSTFVQYISTDQIVAGKKHGIIDAMLRNAAVELADLNLREYVPMQDEIDRAFMGEKDQAK